jgi:hypothetical protein
VLSQVDGEVAGVSSEWPAGGLLLHEWLLGCNGAVFCVPASYPAERGPQRLSEPGLRRHVSGHIGPEHIMLCSLHANTAELVDPRRILLH